MTPRNVRPAWLAVAVDDGPVRGAGPRSRLGELTATLTLRTSAGTVSDPVSLIAGGRPATAVLRVPPSVSLELEPGEDGAVTVVLRPR